MAVTAVLLTALVVLGDRADRPDTTPTPTPGPGLAFGADTTTDAAAPRTRPVISEVSTSNPGDIFDADGDAPDWIELHNPSDDWISLAGWSLSNDPARPQRWALPVRQLAPGERLVVFASGKDRSHPAGELHTDFRLGRTDAEVLLTDPDARIVDHASPGELPRGASWGRHPDDPQRTCWFAFPNPGGPNSPGCFSDLRLGAPTFSVPSGIHPEPFELTITAERPVGIAGDATIYYTLDGSWPDPFGNPDRTFVVDGPIRIADRTPEPDRLALIDTTKPEDILETVRIAFPSDRSTPTDKATVVRARTEHGLDATATYFIGHDPSPAGLPIVSLALDEEFLFDHDTGIAVAGRRFDDWVASDGFDPAAPWWLADANYFGSGRDWQRPVLGDHHRAAVVELCEIDLGCVEQRRVGVRIHGNFSRMFPQKGLRLYADDDPWSPSFGPAFLADQGPAGHRRILLRTAGNDNRWLVFADGYLQSLMGNLAVETQAYRPAVVYLNGEYWGIHNLRERYDQHYLATVHGADPDRVVILDQAFGRHQVQRGPSGAADELDELIAAVAALDPAAPDFGARLEGLVEPSLDLDSFLDFVIAHTFSGNWDWPGNNTRVWRYLAGEDHDRAGAGGAAPEAAGDGVGAGGSAGVVGAGRSGAGGAADDVGAGRFDDPLDGRWRWMVFDLDHAGERAGRFNPAYDVFTDRMAPTDDPGVESGYPALFHRMMQHTAYRDQFLNRFADLLATDFAPTRTLAALDQLEGLLAPEMTRHIDRWRQHDDIAEWRSMVQAKRAFMFERPGRQRRHLEELFGVAPAVAVSVRAEGGGSVQLNGLAVPADGFTGEYWPGVPVTVTARADDGHRFVGWVGTPDAPGAETFGDPTDPTSLLEPTDPTLLIDPGAGLDLVAVFEPA